MTGIQLWSYEASIHVLLLAFCISFLQRMMKDEVLNVIQ